MLFNANLKVENNVNFAIIYAGCYVRVAREMCELAVKACGHFSVGGSDMWQMYRNLENTILSKCLTNIDEGEEMNDTEDDVPEEAKEQFKKVIHTHIFHPSLKKWLFLR